jgi:hypothetical protein
LLRVDCGDGASVNEVNESETRNSERFATSPAQALDLEVEGPRLLCIYLHRR